MAISEVSRYENGIEYKIVTDYDEIADFSLMGEYTNNPDYSHLVIDREMNGDMGYHECRYWESAQTLKELESSRKWFQEHGYSKHDSYELPRSYVRQDYARMEAYDRGDWCYLFITVTAVLDGMELAFASLGGIESDSDADYIEEITNELIAECQSELPETKERLRAIIKKIA
jgi:hypothetical protein